MDSTLFDHHLHLFSAHSPALSFRLKSIQQCKPVVDEALEINKGKLDQADVLYLFGLPGQQAWTGLEPWLRENQKRYLAILVHDEEELAGWLKNAFVGPLLADPQIKVCHFDRHNAEDPLFQWLNLFFVALKPMVAAMPYYESNHLDLYHARQTRLLRDAATTERIVYEFLKMGDLFYTNFFSNIFRLNGARSAEALFGKFKAVPAIICGAGPSLNKNLPILKELSERAILFAGGSAINALNHSAMTPHFGAATDPHPPQEERLMSQNGFETPLFYRSRWNRAALAAAHAPRLYLHGACGYPVAAWMEERLNIDGRVLEEGDNVIHECLLIAYEMGCDPIIFVGMDLSYEGDKPYADGVNCESHWSALQSMRSMDLPIRKASIDGGEVYTHWKWVEESAWISRFASQHPERRFINATEGGIGFEGIANLNLSEAADRWLRRSFPLAQRIHAEIQRAPRFQCSSEEIASNLRELESSLERCQSLLKSLVDEDHSSGMIALMEIELDEEVGYQLLLATPAFVHGSLFHRLQDQLKEEMDETREAQLRRRISLEKHQFLQRAAEAILEILQQQRRSPC